MTSQGESSSDDEQGADETEQDYMTRKQAQIDDLLQASRRRANKQWMMISCRRTMPRLIVSAD